MTAARIGFDPRQYEALSHGYALATHQCQGV
jgi:hypothetical protein